MTEALFQLLWLCLYGYFIEQNGTIQKGAARRLVTGGIALAALVTALLAHPFARWSLPAGWVAVTVLFLLYDLFFDEERFRVQWWKVLLPGAFCTMAALLSPAQAKLDFLLNGVLLCSIFTLLAQKRGYCNFKNEALLLAVYAVLVRLAAAPSGTSTFPWGILALEYLIFFLLENALFSYQKGFAHETEHFQREVLGHQYDEIKNIYMNMRGWRHDYHNHLQVMKAQMAQGQLTELAGYLDELERDLTSVDTYIKSGNLMTDAILNSKLTLAEKSSIRVNCKATLPEQLPIEDVDLCVILGNLLDNALEACQQIPAENRFLRIYMVVNKSQLYLSVQNSAREELNFNERHYITDKRGNHGFGMRRVKALVDKYDGYLNLANEPGIFAAEVTMPLQSAACIS